ncbi:SRPBCC family protein [Chloroflexota bacterium]
MIKVDIQMEIEAPTEMVFDLLADHTQHPLWDPNMIEGRFTTEGPIVNGSKGITIGTFRGKRVESDIYYDAYDRPKWVSGGASSGMVKGKQTCEFVPTEKGTKINWAFEAQFQGFMRFMEPFMKSTLIKQRQETLEALKTYITKNR